MKLEKTAGEDSRNLVFKLTADNEDELKNLRSLAAYLGFADNNQLRDNNVYEIRLGNTLVNEPRPYLEFHVLFKP